MQRTELIAEYRDRRPSLLQRLPELLPSMFAAGREGGLAWWLGAVADLGAEAHVALSPEQRSATIAFLEEVLVARVADEGFDPYEVATIFAAAAGLGIDAKPLADAWLAVPDAELGVARVLATEWITPGGEPKSLEEQIGRLAPQQADAAFERHVDPQRALLRALTTEAVRAWIEQRRVHEADPERAELLSAVEERIRAERARS